MHIILLAAHEILKYTVSLICYFFEDKLFWYNNGISVITRWFILPVIV